jgi:hypothetical protein
MSNVHIVMREAKSRKKIEERDSHNIFINYGRDWLAHVIALQAAGVPFREDRIRYMAYGIGGTAQIVASADIRTTYGYPDFPDAWNGGGGSGDPQQTDTDPTVLGLEWPVEVTSGDYYDEVAAPAVFPGSTGVVRFTTVLGQADISFGSHLTVPISEIGLFTESLTQTDAPTVEQAIPTEKYMVAYNTFDSLSKTTAFVLEVDWELRFS